MTAHRLMRAGEWTGAAADRAVLTYEERFLRRRTLTCESGARLLVDLPETVGLNQGDALETDTGPVEILAAPEPLAEVRADPADLVRIAWHVGNRHTPAQIEPGRILIARDHVIEDMLARLGAHVAHVVEPFTPEGGAYGMGRVMGHSHGPGHAHGHSHDHDHDHPHG